VSTERDQLQVDAMGNKAAAQQTQMQV